MKSILRSRFTIQTLRKLVMGGIVCVALMVGLNYWALVRPTSASQRFVQLVLNGQFDVASTMLSIPSRITTGLNSHQLTAIDGTRSEIPVANVELNVFDVPKRPARNGIVDYLLCREHFSVCAIWTDENGSHFVPVFCTTHGSKVVIDHTGIIP